MALTKDVDLPEVIGDYADIPVAAAVKIFQGSLVAVNAAGFAKLGATGDTFFAGVADKLADNSAGAAGDIRVRVKRSIQFRVMTLSGAAQADIGDLLYATDENTITKTASTNLPIGRVHAYLTTDTIIAKLEPNC